ncbi:uncharacterized protein PHACADRAFT_122919 [Phanerochaete carnosa HHB-10118-sp]|uniref:Uncharacterized protein n=1 Tax=Phanerochaete carnosa (strain HHB-10118-sp) TaxID=650164 RepID=K5WUK4_PHACS|nr:uncharacterized protein PHACADRAFT_122919 [Phanerochaete carnosa HHB-10118-sp]EKM54142.1 hypothetical protein PHACADRAFT_122919 [Phanerochaete carnosa HHB-10118-sp]
MDALVNRLQQKLQEHQEHAALRDTISTLCALKGGRKCDDATRESLGNNLRVLRKEGLWTPTADEEITLRELQKPGSSSEALRLTAHSGQASPRLPFSFASPTALPMELYGILNQAYYLHLLATEPENVLPPGKSLISTLLRPHAEHHAQSALHERVEDLVHRAFWDEALESLLNISPPVQLTRLKRLYEDLYIGLSSLLPKSHPVLVTLSLPLSPTSSPLRSAVIHLREVLQSLRQRCAPARDAQLDALTRTLSNLPAGALPEAIIHVVRSTLKIAEEMKDDLSQFVLGTMSEQQLRDVVITEAASREREIVLQLWRLEVVRDKWERWLEEIQYPVGAADASMTGELSHGMFTRRLMIALGTNYAVSCDLPTIAVHTSPSGTPEPEPSADPPPPLPNSLPPPLLFITPSLLHIQNYLQALVITASLRALVRIPMTPLKRKHDADDNEELSEHSFLKRIWTLLKADIEGEPAADGLKLMNLADEVVRISQAYGGTLHQNGVDKQNMEAQLREAVDRTLKPTDLVFQLLQRRLFGAITDHLVQHPPPRMRSKVAPGMHTGRTTGRLNGHKPKLELDGHEGMHLQLDFARETLNVKGFEHPVLAGAVSDILLKLRVCIAWTQLGWTDLLEKS